MKKILNYIKIMVLLLTICAFSACKKMDSTYKEYKIPGGGLIYPGKVTSPVVYAGHNRVKIAWLRGSDASVINARIYWNNYSDSLNVPIPPTGDTISVIIDNLLEQTYSFVVKTYDNKGNSSVPVELLGGSYGNKYQSRLLDRPIITSEMDLTSNILNFQWGTANVTGGFYANEVIYTDNVGDTKVKFFKVQDLTSVIEDYKPGTPYQLRTLYVPNGVSIDTFYTAYSVQRASAKINKSVWTATADSYALTSQAPNGAAIKAVDDIITTFWHTDHTTTKPAFPHWLAVNMKKLTNVSRVELTCRPGVVNTFTAFTIQGSMDGLVWTSYDSFTLLQKDPTQSFMITGSPRMQYIRIYATAGSQYYANLAEFSVIGYE